MTGIIPGILGKSVALWPSVNPSHDRYILCFPPRLGLCILHLCGSMAMQTVGVLELFLKCIKPDSIMGKRREVLRKREEKEKRRETTVTKFTVKLMFS